MNLSQRDTAIIWHPLTQHFNQSLPKAIVRGEGAYLFDEEGRHYLDLISSWWVNLHGHCHPEIAAAIYRQAQTIEQVIFAGFTHAPAVQLAEKLLALLPPHFGKVFYSDDGSTAVEVAIKMAYQYWRNQGEHQRRRFIAFKNGYHGDTFGAMALGNASHYFNEFADLFFPVEFFPYPETSLFEDQIADKEAIVLNQLADYLENHAREVAALIIEPLVQGSAGMRMCRVEFLKALEQLLKSYGVLMIYDEIMTGFGRTGEYFACLKANTQPDIICLSKGLTGGFMPLSVTISTDRIYSAFLSDQFSKSLVHSHSFTANPLGCSAALASMQLLCQDKTKAQIKTIEMIHHAGLKALSTLPTVEKLRVCGTIAAFDLVNTAGYGSTQSVAWRKRFMDQGLLIRPIGNAIYLMPPYCITETDLKRSYDLIIETVGVEYVC